MNNILNSKSIIKIFQLNKFKENYLIILINNINKFLNNNILFKILIKISIKIIDNFIKKIIKTKYHNIIK